MHEDYEYIHDSEGDYDYAAIPNRSKFRDLRHTNMIVFAWADQRHHQCCIDHTARNIKGQCCILIRLVLYSYQSYSNNFLSVRDIVGMGKSFSVSQPEH